MDDNYYCSGYKSGGLSFLNKLVISVGWVYNFYFLVMKSFNAFPFYLTFGKVKIKIKTKIWKFILFYFFFLRFKEED